MRQVVGITAEDQASLVWTPCWTGSFRRPTRRTCVRFWTIT